MSLNLVNSLVEKTRNDVLFLRRNGQRIQHKISIVSLGPTLLRDGDSRAEVGLHLTEYFNCQNISSNISGKRSRFVEQLLLDKKNSTKLEVFKPDAHVHSAVVLTNVEIEVLVLHPI